MDYPLALLPKENHKIIDCDLTGCCLIRHSHLPNVDLLDNLGLLKNEVIQSKDLPDFSTSLFGIFTLEDIKIKVTNGAYQCYCQPNCIVDTPIFEDDFEYDSNRGHWSILFDSIHNQKIEYADQDFTAICQIHHTPMKWNFWHFSVQWYINDINDFWHNNLEYQTPAIRKKLAFEARGLIKKFGKAAVISDKKIKENCYTQAVV